MLNLLIRRIIIYNNHYCLIKIFIGSFETNAKLIKIIKNEGNSLFKFLRYSRMYFYSNKHSSLYTTVNTIKFDIREIVLCIEFYQKLSF